MGGQSAVHGDDRPVVGQHAHRRSAGIDHRLDRQRHAGQEPGIGSVIAPRGNIVRDFRILVHFGADAVADIVAHDAAAVAFRVLLHRSGNVVQAVPRTGILDPFKEALPRDADELQRLRRCLPDREGAGTVSHIALVGGSHVDGNDVSVAHDALSGNAVDDLVVHGNARALREAAVAEKCRRGSTGQDELMDLFVDLFGGYAVSQHLPPDASGRRCDLSGFAHPLDLSL